MMDSLLTNTVFSLRLRSDEASRPLAMRLRTFLSPYLWAGTGDGAPDLVSNDLDPRDATAGNGWGAVLADLKSATTRGGMLYVFSIGGAHP